MAQLVERTLGKGEVPSSILGISTMLIAKIIPLPSNQTIKYHLFLSKYPIFPL